MKVSLRVLALAISRAPVFVFSFGLLLLVCLLSLDTAPFSAMAQFQWACEDTAEYICIITHFNGKPANLSASDTASSDLTGIQFRHLDIATVDSTIIKHFPASVESLLITDSSTLQRIALPANCTLQRLVVMKTLLSSLEFQPNDALHVLTIVASKLQQIPASIYHLRNLAVIKLQQSFIQHLDLDLLDWLRQMETIVLSHNKIRTITSTLAGSERRKLRLLNLNNNQLRIINLEVLAPLAWFEHVDLSHNKIELLVGRYDGEILSSLLLSHNRLKTLDFCQWKPIPTFRLLSLESNELSRVPSCMHHMPNLSYISLSHNKLTSVSMDAFGDMDNLTRLDLAGNQISLITFHEQKHPKGLVELILKQNKVECNSYQREIPFCPLDIEFLPSSPDSAWQRNDNALQRQLMITTG